MPPAHSGTKRQIEERRFMKRALLLARRGIGLVSPNPVVGAILVKKGQIIGEGWHRGPGKAHAEPDAIQNALKNHHSPKGSTLFVTLEPCSTYGRTPPCTKTIIEHQIKKVIVATTDPNPNHAGRGIEILKDNGIGVETGLLQDEANDLNPSFNHWIVHQSPLVTIKAAMTLDGKIATAKGESKWITGARARKEVMKMRLDHDAILVGIETLLNDDPSLTVRVGPNLDRSHSKKQLRRIILDTKARTPQSAKVCNDQFACLTTIVVGQEAPMERVRKLQDKVAVWKLRTAQGKISLKALLQRLNKESITSLLVEGGGQVNASFLEQGLAHKIAFFYAPKILGGSQSRPAVGGNGYNHPDEFLRLRDSRWRSLPPDLLLTANI
jgi:diaminohydroxyphosphoribosylaminopyrimidine deaminase / 5-amino-6-(5-phosphoribosylamino)uracil reductase